MAASPSNNDEEKTTPKRKNKPQKKSTPVAALSKQVEGAAEKKTVRSKSKSKKVAAERFDIHGGNGRKSLKDFFESKKPGAANGPRIAVIGYYITEVLEEESFSEGQIEYAYKMLGLKRPNHLHQIMINNKNEKDWYEQMEGEGNEYSWQLTRAGEIFVGDNLPAEE